MRLIFVPPENGLRCGAIRPAAPPSGIGRTLHDLACEGGVPAGCEKRQAEKEEMPVGAQLLHDAGIGVWMSISVSTSTKSVSDTRKFLAGAIEPMACRAGCPRFRLKWIRLRPIRSEIMHPGAEMLDWLTLASAPQQARLSAGAIALSYQVSRSARACARCSPGS